MDEGPDVTKTKLHDCLSEMAQWMHAHCLKLNADTPTPPTVTYPQRMTEGLPVAITCSVEHTCPTHPPSLAWDKIKRNVSVYHQELSDGIWRTVLLLKYTPAAEHHEEDFVCSATYPSGKSASKSISLAIRYSPKGVHAVLAEDPEEGHLMELSCVVMSSNPRDIHFTWYKNNKMIEKQEGKALKIERAAMDDAGDYHCVAHNVMGSASSTAISVNVKYGFQRKRSHPGLWTCIFLAAGVAVSIAVAVPAWRYIKNKKKGNSTSPTEVQQEYRRDGPRPGTNSPSTSDEAQHCTNSERTSRPGSSNNTAQLLTTPSLTGLSPLRPSPDYVNVDNHYTALVRSQISPEYDCLRR
ncbi:B-cell receptor CD22-like [Lissotriton helveticus]